MHTTIDAPPDAEARRDRVLLALADPTRRAILDVLVQGDARVTDLARPFDISLNSVSKHIRMLERADLVRRQRSGREHIIALNPAALDETTQWLNAQRAAWQSRLQALDDLLQEQDRASAATPASTGADANERTSG